MVKDGLSSRYGWVSVGDVRLDYTYATIIILIA